MEIRRARDEDYVEIADLRQSTIRSVNAKDYPEQVINRWSSTSKAEDFRESDGQCKRWMALEDGKVIGFCEHTFACEISRVYVHKDHLRKGVGSRLLKVAEDSLKEQGCLHIRIESTITAKEFYASNGYEVIERTTYFGDEHAPVYVMSKAITE
ncbi:MAG: GNAT family N-acetyltransferase [Chloroflexota bacterium]|nr:GNAT family N-acetyltransferase [Chloroflexota bacterium]